MSSIPTSFYGIHPNDDRDLHQNFMVPIDSSYNMGYGEPLYPSPFDAVPAPSFPNPNNISATQPLHEEQPAFLTNGVTDDVGLAPGFPMYSTFPHFQTPLPFAMAPGLFLSGLPTSPESTLAPSPCPSRGNLPKRKRNHKSKKICTKRIAADPAKSKRVALTRPTRSLTRNTGGKPQSAGFEDMFNKLPLEVQRALNTLYTGCCESMTDRDNATRQKHMFTRRHCGNLPKEYLGILPCFVCPAYVAFHGACVRAEPGRYDSADRHCKSCAGYEEMNSKSKIQIPPLEITKGEHEAIKIYHSVTPEHPPPAEDKEKSRLLVENSVNKLLGRTVGHENFQIHDPDSREAIHARIFESLGIM